MKKRDLIVAAIISGIVGATIGITNVAKQYKIQRAQLSALSDKHLALFLMMDQWVKNKQDGKSIAQYLIEKGYKKIAVYGMGYAGQTLVSELRNTQVEVIYGIDQNADDIGSEINIVSKEAVVDNVDAVIVTAITFYDEIKRELEGRMRCPIISLEDIIYEM